MFPGGGERGLLQIVCCLGLFGAAVIKYRSLTTCKRWTFISHGSGGWKVPRQGIWQGADSVSGGSLPPGSGMAIFLAINSQSRSSEGALWVSLMRAVNPFMLAPPSWPNHLPKFTLPNSITLGRRG